MSASKKPRRLGRGLDALLQPIHEYPGTGHPPKSGHLMELAVEEVHPNPNQPRQMFDPSQLDELAESIRNQGIVQPVVVRARPEGGYELIAGERRWRAAQVAGVANIPCLIKRLSDNEAMVVSLVENVQREDLHPLEEATALMQMQSALELTHAELAGMLGRSRSAVTNTIRLLALTERVRELFQSGRLEMGHARALLALENPTEQITLAQQVVDAGLSVRQTEQLVGQRRGGTKRFRRRSTGDPDTDRLQRRLSDMLGLDCRVRTTGRGSGELKMRFARLDELQRVLQRLGYREDDA